MSTVLVTSGSKIVVGVADMGMSTTCGDVIVTHALGSCLGIAVFDPVSCVGGMLHVMLPSSSINPEKAKENPYMFVDSGLPKFFHELYKSGAQKNRLIVKVAGGASIQNRGKDSFEIGKRNSIALKKLFWKNNIMIEASDVGGSKARTMYLEIVSGKVSLSKSGNITEL